MNHQTCKECQFWSKKELQDHTNIGQCKIKSPIVDDAVRGSSLWPWTDGDDWCGEFKMLPELEPCHICHKPVGENPKYFFSHYGFGPFCSDECLKERQKQLSDYHVSKGGEPIIFK